MVSKRPCPSPMTAKMVFRSANLSQKENVYPIPLKPNHHREGCSMLPHPDRASHARKFVPLRCVKSPVDRICSPPHAPRIHHFAGPHLNQPHIPWGRMHACKHGYSGQSPAPCQLSFPLTFAYSMDCITGTHVIWAAHPYLRTTGGTHPLLPLPNSTPLLWGYPP